MLFSCFKFLKFHFALRVKSRLFFLRYYLFLLSENLTQWTLQRRHPGCGLRLWWSAITENDSVLQLSLSKQWILGVVVIPCWQRWHFDHGKHHGSPWSLVSASYFNFALSAFPEHFWAFLLLGVSYYSGHCRLACIMNTIKISLKILILIDFHNCEINLDFVKWKCWPNAHF